MNCQYCYPANQCSFHNQPCWFSYAEIEDVCDYYRPEEHNPESPEHERDIKEEN